MAVDSFDLTTSGLNCYVLIWDPNQGSGEQLVWKRDTGAFVTFGPVDYADYIIQANEFPSSVGHYVYEVPTNLPPGNYQVTAKTGTFGAEDPSNRTVASGELGWNGVVIIDNVRIKDGVLHGGPETQLMLHDSLGAGTPFAILNDNATGGSAMTIVSSVSDSTGIPALMISGKDSGVLIQGKDPSANSFGAKMVSSFDGTVGALAPALLIQAHRGASSVKIAPGVGLTGKGVEIISGFNNPAVSISTTSGSGGSADGVVITAGGPNGNAFVLTRGGSGGDDLLLTNSDAPTLATAVWGFVVEAGFTAVSILRLIVSILMNKAASGASTVAFRDIADTKDRLVFTVDSNGNRSAVTRDPS